ncbi:MAG: FHA domain-containing protein [Verrucomicrobia bacterium]|jgi:pSer/pThr/pTyr-binding forkhead associated (FHA) protein|nr:FHA domain-containing protein [Verrucomicrobiota bacterium]MBT7068707.1 FHA domain-containing protein [Verrucomicrobiota bacterium]MBT7701856.1 FHA domain-containing protein [Verrucomicrobiota bacterium]
MNETTHLTIEKGLEEGRNITIPAAGARVGRSSKNDVVITDPLMSRHHCRIGFKENRLCVSDLGSANETLVNDAPIREVQLSPGDHILLGETTLRVVTHTLQPIAASEGDNVDLGLRPPAPAVTPTRRPVVGLLLIVAAVVIAIALAVWLPKMLMPPAANPGSVALAPVVELPAHLSISYEKVEATPENIFRYALTLTEGRMLSVQIDDIMNNRHVRKESRLGSDYVRALGDTISEAGFFGLNTDYQGIQPDSLDSWDLSITIGHKTQRTRVINRVEPDAFKRVCEIIEECGKNELGLWAIQFSPERLLVMAREAYLEGQRLDDAREVENSNLAKAITAYDEAQWYLETVEPKPDYYPDILTAISEAKEQLQARYDDLNFSAERSIRIREWEQAANELRVICDVIPNRTDARHEKARQKLLDIENRLRMQK